MCSPIRLVSKTHGCRICFHKRQKTSVRNGRVGLPPTHPVRRGQLSGGALSEDEEDEVDREENVYEERRKYIAKVEGQKLFR